MFQPYWDIIKGLQVNAERSVEGYNPAYVNKLLMHVRM